MSDAFYLPVDEVLSEIQAVLAEETRLVLAAPPGAGKTTRVPLCLLDEAWRGDGRILVLEPRRLAARMAAARMAQSLGEPLGRTVGLSTRIERKVSSATRIEVVTDGLFTRRILADPELKGVAAVIFDEVHERSLAADLGLALARDAQAGLREDLRLIVMSATLDTARMAKALDAPVIESDGRMHPVETRYLGRADDRIEDAMAAAVRRALHEETGSILAFLPGAGEIRRAAERLEDLPSGVAVAPLYGALSPAEQDAAVRPASAGQRKVVLATDIAESSLTIEGVRVVIDAGLARVPEALAGGGTRLVTRRASKANVDQRRGRAGRTEPGVCYRLWDEAQTRGLPPEPEPEILAADLSGLALSLAEWGVADRSQLAWIDPPPAGRFVAARNQLVALGALDASGGLTDRGRKMAQLPLPPNAAAMVAGAKTNADAALAAEMAALMAERGLGGQSTDLRTRIERFRGDRSPRAQTLRRQAARWGGAGPPGPIGDAGRVVAEALPGRIARRRPGSRGDYSQADGRAVTVAEDDPLGKSDWIVVLDATGAGAAPRVVLAAALTEAEALAANPPVADELTSFDADAGELRARRVKRMGAIVLSETPAPKPRGAAATAALLAAVRAQGLGIVPGRRGADATAARLALLRSAGFEEFPDWDEAALVEETVDALAHLLGDPPSLARPSEDQIAAALVARLAWPGPQEIERLAPKRIDLPSGRSAAVDYLSDQAPLLSARVQDWYGCAEHPTIAGGRAPLTLELLSPASRPVAVTKDLPGFWAGGYRDMAKDMRGRYPKHDWPDNPANAAAHPGWTRARREGR